jgi:hypothetical protein
MPFVWLNPCIIIDQSFASAKAAIIFKRWYKIVRVEMPFVKMVFYSVDNCIWTLSFQFIA